MTVRSSTSTTIANTLGTAITGAAPAGLTAGDRLLAWIVQDTAATHTGPSGEGWTKIADANNVSPADSQTCTVWEKKSASGSETFAFTSSINKRAIIQVVALTGRHASTAATVSTPTITNTPVATSPFSMGLSGLTAATSDDLLWFGQVDQASGADAWSFSALSGFTNLQNVANSDWISSATFAQENATAGATGTLTATVTRTAGGSNYSWSGLVVAIPAGASGPTVSTVSSASNTEGSAVVHTVTLSGATSGSTNFAATLVGVTATGSGTDFTSDLASATYSNGVTFSGGNMVVPDAVSGWTVTIATTSDALDEANETYTLTVGGVSGTGTINDDDAAPTISVDDVTESAGSCIFTVSLSAASGKSITVDYATADGTSTAGVDYTAASGTLTFAAGETTKTVTVTVP